MQNKRVLFIFLIIILISMLIGGIIVYKWFPKIVTEYIETHKEIPVVQERVVTQTKTEVQYVPKEKDPETGKLEKTDVQVDIKQPTVDVKVNGKNYDFNLLQGESQAFEKGKVVVTQNNEIKLNIKQNDTLRVEAFAGKGYGVTLTNKNLSVDINIRDKEFDRVRLKLFELKL